MIIILSCLEKLLKLSRKVVLYLCVSRYRVSGPVVFSKREIVLAYQY